MAWQVTLSSEAADEALKQAEASLDQVKARASYRQGKSTMCATLGSWVCGRPAAQLMPSSTQRCQAPLGGQDRSSDWLEALFCKARSRPLFLLRACVLSFFLFPFFFFCSLSPAAPPSRQARSVLEALNAAHDPAGARAEYTALAATARELAADTRAVVGDINQAMARVKVCAQGRLSRPPGVS